MNVDKHTTIRITTDLKIRVKALAKKLQGLNKWVGNISQNDAISFAMTKAEEALKNEKNKP